MIFKRYMLKDFLMFGICFKIILWGVGERSINEIRLVMNGNLLKLGNEFIGFGTVFFLILYMFDC